jgi:hypothetical protein
VNLDPAHYRSGRWFLLAQGLVLIGLGLAVFIQRWQGVAGTPDGVPVLWLRLTPLHAWVLLAFGVSAVAATPWRRAATAVVAVGAAGFLLLFAIGTPAAAGATAGVRGVAASPGPSLWGMDLGDSALHVGLLVYNLVLLFWLATTAMQGPVWVRRREAKRDRPTRAGSPEVSGNEAGSGATGNRPGDTDEGQA